MKTFSGETNCENCNKIFTWIYKCPTYCRYGSGITASQVISYGTNQYIKENNLAICKRKIKIPNKLEYFVTNCPFCYYPFSFECTDDILKDLYS